MEYLHFAATDVLLSHIITFLNDKIDWRLRASFFECCPTVAQFVGRQSTYILKSLLQQVSLFYIKSFIHPLRKMKVLIRDPEL